MDGLMTALADTGMKGPWLNVYLIYAATTLGIVIWCLLIRIAIGASPSYLARTRCYEVPPLHLIFHAVHVEVWLVFATAVIVAVR